MTACYICGTAPVKARRMCSVHYDRWWRTGNPLLTRRVIGDDIARFWSKVDRRSASECWPWTDPLVKGYGRIEIQQNGERLCVGAHRFSYELLVEPIPDDLDLDHTCHDPRLCPGGGTCPHRACVNPAHLEPVTPLENALRAMKDRNRCTAGHLYGQENTYVDRLGKRHCRECRRAALKRLRKRRPGDFPGRQNEAEAEAG